MARGSVGAPLRYALIERIEEEFRGTPGLALTPRQAARILGESPETVSLAIDARRVTGVLVRTRDGSYQSRLMSGAPETAWPSRRTASSADSPCCGNGCTPARSVSS